MQQITLPQAVSLGFKKYTDFSGRVNRPEFWFWVLFVVLVSVATHLVDNVLGTVSTDGHAGLFNGLFSLGTLVPSLAIGARRLHDIGRSGWWQFLVFIPIVGIVVLIVWWATKGSGDANSFDGGASNAPSVK